jgi:hypothetical protein
VGGKGDRKEERRRRVEMRDLIDSVTARFEGAGDEFSRLAHDVRVEYQYCMVTPIVIHDVKQFQLNLA